MLLKGVKNEVTVDINFEIPVGPGEVIEFKSPCRFKVLPLSEFKQRVEVKRDENNNILPMDLTDEKIIREHLVGWDMPGPVEGEKVELNDNSKQAVIDNVFYVKPIANGFVYLHTARDELIAKN